MIATRGMYHCELYKQNITNILSIQYYALMYPSNLSQKYSRLIANNCN